MGNDGGSIPTRRELVKEVARNPTATELKDRQQEHLAHRWSICPLSNTPLVKPIVSDHAGNLYNKDAIIQFLLPAEVSAIDKDEYERFIQGRVKSLKDVVEVQFEVDQDEESKESRWVCPITSKQLGPSVKAVYIVPCGHAFSQEAIKEMKSDGKCVQCGTAYEERDIVPILASTEKDKAQLIERVELLRALGLTHALKKASSCKKRKATREPKSDIVGAGSHEGMERELVRKAKGQMNGGPPSGTPQSSTSTPKLSSGIKDSATASLTARVLHEEETRKKRRQENENINSLYSKKSTGTEKNKGDFMTRGFSIPANARYD
ncbi:uncharacterized protein A1O9_03703 [Exophiala aquamarina CBS 119918]|uniref:Uncharacterized protein n=1 Tax=Exophiala aquamarina CBS 119918 TaxID=1182545 RepID=A0A072PTM9_9EURO|nr:uncharacterized protein A1O9_03703 [Exophiala aquamarina CBS 119918]KEF58860.1 hypothetical protein A1O9_03703 [Exophiala aquamarina CBS 119918]